MSDLFDTAEAIGWRRFSKPEAKTGPRQFYCAMWNSSLSAFAVGKGSTRARAQQDAGRVAVEKSQMVAALVQTMPGMSS